MKSIINNLFILIVTTLHREQCTNCSLIYGNLNRNIINENTIRMQNKYNNHITMTTSLMNSDCKNRER